MFFSEKDLQTGLKDVTRCGQRTSPGEQTAGIQGPKQSQPILSLRPHSSVSLCRALCSQTAGLLLVFRVFKSRFRGRAFSFQASPLCNQLPVCNQETYTRSAFKIKL